MTWAEVVERERALIDLEASRQAADEVTRARADVDAVQAELDAETTRLNWAWTHAATDEDRDDLRASTARIQQAQARTQPAAHAQRPARTPSQLVDRVHQLRRARRAETNTISRERGWVTHERTWELRADLRERESWSRDEVDAYAADRHDRLRRHGDDARHRDEDLGDDIRTR